ncbi:MAG: 3-phosphoshikimate 1-carboxyvinyltransferase [Bacteroidales bacterium]|nr:3-phosphoshikimate 1-carboxyvinyltransferase [Bacteroidales bacterium]
MICTSVQNGNYSQILEILSDPGVEMAEIRLDRCPLSEEEISDLFANSDTPLIATCRIAEAGQSRAQRLLRLAIEAGARYVDLEIDAPVNVSKSIQKAANSCGVELIRSYHNFDLTPSDEVLQMALARCFRYGADVAKIVTACNTEEDCARLQSLYSVILEGIDSMEGRLIAFGMGDPGRRSRIECLKRGAPFTYASISGEECTAPGQMTFGRMSELVYGARKPYSGRGLRMPASKSFAQRAIIAAALAEGTSHLRGYTPCADSESAIRVAEAIGAKITRGEGSLTIRGAGPVENALEIERLHTGESGLLTRLMIPLMSVLNGNDVTIDGEGTLLRRPLTGAAEIMAAFGVIVKEPSVPLKVRGRLIPGTAEISGQSGSQLISGLLMALPLCTRSSTIFVSEPKSIPYMYITLDVLRHFGVHTRTEMEGDAEMLEMQDWSCCSGITFNIRGGQRYRAADFDIEGDWSAAANLMVAGAVFGSVEIEGLDMKSLQADITVTDILVDAGACVSQLEDSSCVCVRKAPLRAFEADLNHAPDLFPIIAVLAAFCSGESRICGVERLSGKESDRADAILEMLGKMGVEASVEGDTMRICGESLSSRILCGRLLKGGKYSSRHDHRMVMALKVAGLGADAPIEIDDEACVGKSFPGFNGLL